MLFGINDERQAVNLIILLGKQYIVKCKLSENQIEPSFEGAIIIIKHHVQLEKHTATANNTLESFASKWRGLTDEIDTDMSRPTRALS